MEKPPFEWTCPHCQRATTIIDSNIDDGAVPIGRSWANEWAWLRFIVCPNPKCKRYTLIVELVKKGETTKVWQLVPASSALVFPDYIPKAILEDYTEACLIKELSPRASATLSRRCLQGMIRDYWKVKGGKLANEIQQIKDKLESQTWQAIDAVRNVGNIGAHMEEDVNLIVDIEPNEAQLLITLIETLIKDWYIARHDRESNLKAIIQLGKDKDEAKNPKS